MQCSFEKEITYPNGSYLYSRCVNKADILITNDPCYGLCFICAYNKLREENEKLREACQAALDYLQEIPEFDWEKDLIEFIIEILEGK